MYFIAQLAQQRLGTRCKECRRRQVLLIENLEVMSDQHRVELNLQPLAKFDSGRPLRICDVIHSVALENIGRYLSVYGLSVV